MFYVYFDHFKLLCVHFASLCGRLLNFPTRNVNGHLRPQHLNSVYLFSNPSMILTSQLPFSLWLWWRWSIRCQEVRWHPWLPLWLRPWLAQPSIISNELSSEPATNEASIVCVPTLCDWICECVCGFLCVCVRAILQWNLQSSPEVAAVASGTRAR